MPAIASLEDLKSAQKEGLSIYAMLSALCALLYEDGVKLGGRMSVNYGWGKGAGTIEGRREPVNSVDLNSVDIRTFRYQE